MDHPTAKRLICTAMAAMLAGAVLGCGSKSGAPQEDADAAKSADGAAVTAKSKAATGGAAKSNAPTVAVKGNSPAEDDPEPPAPPKKGTPQWYVHEMVLLRLQKYPNTTDLERLRALRRERNLKIIKLAEEAIAATNKDKSQPEVFNATVHYLIESRVELAQQGREEDIGALYDLADVLYKRDKTSKSAAEAAYKVAVFANTNAMRYPDAKSGWLTEFVRRARLFATDFPQRKAQAVQLLDVAGRSCELNGRTTDAITCYEQLIKQFPDMPQARYAAAVLRRLRLPGRPLELAGQTLDGGFLDVKDYKGKVVLVAFWSTDRKACRETLPGLKQLGDRYKKSGFEIVGVNLDVDEPPVDDYLEKSKIGWPQIFYANRSKRRWDNPVVKYYAIRNVPTLWLVDANGKVIDADADPKKLEPKVRSLLQRRVSKR
jgi:thiol-disulfide isomerase/thioredoxin